MPGNKTRSKERRKNKIKRKFIELAHGDAVNGVRKTLFMSETENEYETGGEETETEEKIEEVNESKRGDEEIGKGGKKRGRDDNPSSQEKQPKKDRMNETIAMDLELGTEPQGGIPLGGLLQMGPPPGGHLAASLSMVENGEVSNKDLMDTLKAMLTNQANIETKINAIGP